MTRINADNEHKEQYDFFAFLSRMRYIGRWGLMRNTVSENIQEHSLDVAVIAHALVLIRNTYFDGNLDPNKIALYGIFHDASEIFTGDMPTPVKHFNPDFKKSFQKNQGLRIGQAFYTYMKLDKCQQDDEFCEKIWNVDDKDVWGLIGPRIDYNN